MATWVFNDIFLSPTPSICAQWSHYRAISSAHLRKMHFNLSCRSLSVQTWSQHSDMSWLCSEVFTALTNRYLQCCDEPWQIKTPPRFHCSQRPVILPPVFETSHSITLNSVVRFKPAVLRIVLDSWQIIFWIFLHFSGRAVAAPVLLSCGMWPPESVGHTIA